MGKCVLCSSGREIFRDALLSCFPIVYEHDAVCIRARRVRNANGDANLTVLLCRAFREGIFMFLYDEMFIFSYVDECQCIKSIMEIVGNFR